MFRITRLILVAALVLSACGEDGPAASDPTAPDTTAPGGMPARDGDPAYVDSVDLLFLESYPVQVRAIIAGSLPTPCHTAGWQVGDPDLEGRIVLEMFSTVEDPDAVCAQVLEPFEATIDLGSFETGDYLLEVNGVEYPFTI